MHYLLSKVKEYIDEFLDPKNRSYVDNLTVNEALKFFNIVNIDNYEVLLLSLRSAYKIRFRRPQNSCFSN